MTLAAEEYQRIDEVLSELAPGQWDAPTDCTQWRVREIVAHLIGAAEASASVREQLRQQRAGHRVRGERRQLDAVNEVQVSERAGMSTGELRRGLTDAAERALLARTRTPAAVRGLHFPFPPPLGWASLGFLGDIVYTRDAWMHRIDICRAAGLNPRLTPEHDGHIVADAARAWQRATGGSALDLTGPAGGNFPCPSAAPTAVFDAVDFARALAGRGRLPGIRDDVVLF
ncbi:maleylpyruvate isomerase family mycothiol-dependent enzyme [Parafrigoribacterium humi]|uniref:maleylpyruvate isomerase family mycothiol-dependent enzyme n=1 Tax=Parafrigoribacterium humi TaxID=3144664 RepID=UPI0032F02D30